jgi:hypothetical protein
MERQNQGQERADEKPGGQEPKWMNKSAWQELIPLQVSVEDEEAPRP